MSAGNSFIHHWVNPHCFKEAFRLDIYGNWGMFLPDWCHMILFLYLITIINFFSIHACTQIPTDLSKPSSYPKLHGKRKKKVRNVGIKLIKTFVHIWKNAHKHCFVIFSPLFLPSFPPLWYFFLPQLFIQNQISEAASCSRSPTSHGPISQRTRFLFSLFIGIII